ncbi:hypothetical protein LI172_18060 [Coprococcus catus]|uniref:hypothetical protein n=1 Tax=Coprococcus catus TaxID=116085 RepID=UPI001D06BC78|nr:hypothetical protein [Coprococcus catus]MCB6494567.1 hypothetical protein [Coprococcus catus]
MRRLKCEKETIILTNEDDGWATARKKEHKNPPNLKTNSEGNLGYNKITHPNIVFFIW